MRGEVLKGDGGTLGDEALLVGKLEGLLRVRVVGGAEAVDLHPAAH